MGWLKELDASDAALFITLFTLSAVMGIVVLSAFTAIQANAIAMIVLGKLMVILDAAMFYFFQNKKSASGPSETPITETTSVVFAEHSPKTPHLL